MGLHDCTIMIVNNLKIPRNFVGRHPVLGPEELQKVPGVKDRAHSYFRTGSFCVLQGQQVGPWAVCAWKEH